MRMLMQVRVIFFSAVLSAALLSGCATMGTSGYPKPAADFRLALVGGGEVTLSEFRGKPLVMGIGATWCPHCLHEAPIFRRVYDRYKGRIGMLGILVKSPVADAESLVKKNDLNFKIALDPEGEVKKAYGVTGIPVIFFLDEDGNIMEDVFGGIEEDELVKKIEKLLAAEKKPTAP